VPRSSLTAYENLRKLLCGPTIGATPTTSRRPRRSHSGDNIEAVTYITALNDPLEIVVSRGLSDDLPVCLWIESPDSSWPIALSDKQALLLVSEILAALAETEQPR
jgi:hypothetical protein